MRLRAPLVGIVALGLAAAGLVNEAAGAASGKGVPRGLHQTASAPTSVTVAWRPIPKATAYRAVLVKKSGAGKPRRRTVVSPSATFEELRPGTRYAISVRALIGPKAKPGGISRSLRVATAPAPAADGLRVTASAPLAVAIDWNDTPGAASYRLRMASRPDMAGAVEMGFAESAASVRGLPPKSTYYAQAMGLDGAGRPIGGWSAVIPVTTPAAPPPPSKPALTVASFNVRCANCYQRQNGEKPWSARRTAVISQIISRRPDVIGVQEASQGLLDGSALSQFADLRNGLHAAGGAYEVTNTARYNCANPNSANNCSPQDRGASQGTRIFYNTATVELAKAGSKLLPSCRDCNNRYMAWAILKQKSTNQRFFFATVHTQYLAKYAALRHQEVQMMMDEVAAQNPGLPAFVTGDFNSTRYQSPTNAPYDEVIRRGFVDPLGHTPKSAMVSPASTAERRIRANYNSHNNFLRRVAKFADWQNGSNLDYIFTYSPTGPMRVPLWETVLDLDADDRIVGTIPSDHNMLLIKAVLP